MTDFHVIIFKLSFFHKKSIWFSFFLTLSWRNKGKRHGHKTWQKVIWLIQSSKYKSRMKPSSVYYTLYVNNLLLRVFMYPIPLDTVENEPQELYFFCFVIITWGWVGTKKWWLCHKIICHNKVGWLGDHWN